MHQDHDDAPGPEALDELADIEAGDGRMANARHFRALARRWRLERETTNVLRDALLKATREKAQARFPRSH